MFKTNDLLIPWPVMFDESSSFVLRWRVAEFPAWVLEIKINNHYKLYVFNICNWRELVLDYFTLGERFSNNLR